MPHLPFITAAYAVDVRGSWRASWAGRWWRLRRAERRGWWLLPAQLTETGDGSSRREVGKEPDPSTRLRCGLERSAAPVAWIIDRVRAGRPAAYFKAPSDIARKQPAPRPGVPAWRAGEGGQRQPLGRRASVLNFPVTDMGPTRRSSIAGWCPTCSARGRAWSPRPLRRDRAFRGPRGAGQA